MVGVLAHTMAMCGGSGMLWGQRGPDFCPRVGHRCEFVRKPMLAVVLPVQRRLTVGVDARVLVDSQGAGCGAVHQVC